MVALEPWELIPALTAPSPNCLNEISTLPQLSLPIKWARITRNQKGIPGNGQIMFGNCLKDACYELGQRKPLHCQCCDRTHTARWEWWGDISSCLWKNQPEGGLQPDPYWDTGKPFSVQQNCQLVRKRCHRFLFPASKEPFALFCCFPGPVFVLSGAPLISTIPDFS